MISNACKCLKRGIIIEYREPLQSAARRQSRKKRRLYELKRNERKLLSLSLSLLLLLSVGMCFHLTAGDIFSLRCCWCCCCWCWAGSCKLKQKPLTHSSGWENGIDWRVGRENKRGKSRCCALFGLGGAERRMRSSSSSSSSTHTMQLVKMGKKKNRISSPFSDTHTHKDE